MLKKVLKVFKKVVIAALLIYSYDTIASLYGNTIPINIWTVGSVTILGIPCLLAIIFLKILVF